MIKSEKVAVIRRFALNDCRKSNLNQSGGSPGIDSGEALLCSGAPEVGLALVLGADALPVGGAVAEERLDGGLVGVVQLLDAAVAERHLAHPVDTAAGGIGQHQADGAALRGEAVGGEVVVGQVLAVVVRGQVVDMHLVAVLSTNNKFCICRNL